MTSDLGGAGKFLEDAEDLWRKREALNGVIALRDPITPPKKLTFLTLVVPNFGLPVVVASLLANLPLSWVTGFVKRDHLEQTLQRIEWNLNFSFGSNCKYSWQYIFYWT